MEENMKIFNSVKKVPQEAKKLITGGRLKGMTDIKPMWRIEKLTEMFGPCGIGWKTKILNKEIIDVSNGEKIFTNLEMAEKASLSAMHSAGISNKEIDMILYSSCTPDFLLPPCFSLLQKRLGIKRCIGFDIRSGCAGFGTAMTIADTYIKSGQAHNVLLVGSDVISTRFTSLPVKEYKLKHAFNHMFFGG